MQEGPPPGFFVSVDSKWFAKGDFVSADSKRVSGEFFVSADCKGFIRGQREKREARLKEMMEGGIEL
jgi:hypothetical protein